MQTVWVDQEISKYSVCDFGDTFGLCGSVF